MVIGIIGAGLAGLTAGRLLAKAGHDVTILEKTQGYSGRLATYTTENNSYDYGFSHLTVRSPEFREFTDELLENKLVHPWGRHISFFDGESVITNPNPDDLTRYAAGEGMESIGKYLSRWVDIRQETVGGLTFIGSNRRKKRAWMINLSSSRTFEADAIIFATPAPRAYGILQTSIDEIQTLKIIREIDEVHYSPTYVLLAEYSDLEIPEWQAILCQHSPIEFISNETSKRSDKDVLSIAAHSSGEFASKNREKDEEFVRQGLLKELTKILGEEALSPGWSHLHPWKYNMARKVVDKPFFEFDAEDAPLALVGDYFEGNELDDAYRSGYRLAKHWIEKYSV